MEMLRLDGFLQPIARYEGYKANETIAQSGGWQDTRSKKCVHMRLKPESFLRYHLPFDAALQSRCVTRGESTLSDKGEPDELQPSQCLSPRSCAMICLIAHVFAC
jgi:hypothetical protein